MREKRRMDGEAGKERKLEKRAKETREIEMLGGNTDTMRREKKRDT